MQPIQKGHTAHPYDEDGTEFTSLLGRKLNGIFEGTTIRRIPTDETESLIKGAAEGLRDAGEDSYEEDATPTRVIWITREEISSPTAARPSHTAPVRVYPPAAPVPPARAAQPTRPEVSRPRERATVPLSQALLVTPPTPLHPVALPHAESRPRSVILEWLEVAVVGAMAGALLGAIAMLLILAARMG